MSTTIPGSTELTEYIKGAISHAHIEAKIVRRIIKALADSGNPIVRVFDGEEYTKVTTKHDILNLVFNLDEAHLITKNGAWVRLVLGNEWDVLCDHTVSLEDALKPVNDWIMSNWRHH